MRIGAANRNWICLGLVLRTCTARGRSRMSIASTHTTRPRVEGQSPYKRQPPDQDPDPGEVR